MSQPPENGLFVAKVGTAVPLLNFCEVGSDRGGEQLDLAGQSFYIELPLGECNAFCP